MEVVRYKIIVPTYKDKFNLEKAFAQFHNSDVDVNIVAVNQLIHEYLTEDITGDPQTKNNIIVDEDLYDKLTAAML